MQSKTVDLLPTEMFQAKINKEHPEICDKFCPHFHARGACTFTCKYLDVSDLDEYFYMRSQKCLDAEENARQVKQDKALSDAIFSRED